MIEKMSLKIKILIGVITIAILAIGIVLFNKFSVKTENVATSASAKKLAVEEVVTEVKEEIIVVAQDVDIVETEEEEEQEEVTFKDKTVKVPKSTVAPVNSAEDAETNKKTGGESVSQSQVDQMFQNEGTHSKGIDVSAHQGRINWAQVAASGVEFAIIRCGFRGQTAGKIYEDAYFKTNVAGATAAGIKVGIYFYSTAINENEALEEAAWVVKKISTYRITYPVVYDFEDFGAYRCSSVNGAQATSNALTFLNFVKSNGYEPMMYANKSDITSRLSRGSFPCKFWLAHYTSKTDYIGSYNMWQYTSKGSVPGISGNVDMNIAYFSYGTTAAPKHTHEYTTLVEEKVATCKVEGSKVLRCSCGETKTEALAKLEHTYGKWETVTKPTLEKEGLEKRICSVCKHEDSQKIAKLKDDGNNIANKTEDKNTSVDKNTSIDNTQKENNNQSDNKQDEELDNTNQSQGDDKIQDDVKDENNNGSPNDTTGDEIIGDEEQGEIIDPEQPKGDETTDEGKGDAPAHTHDFTYSEEIIKQPTCNSAGEKVGTCSCGVKSESQSINPTGVHTYVDGICSCGDVEKKEEVVVDNTIQEQTEI